MLATSEIERFFANDPPALLEIVLELRNLIFSIAPDTTELIQWKGISYYAANRGGTVSANLCQIHIVDGCVHLGFIHGVRLPDPAHLLQGSAKSKRFVPIADFDTAPWAAIEALLRASSQLDPYQALK